MKKKMTILALMVLFLIGMDTLVWNTTVLPQEDTVKTCFALIAQENLQIQVFYRMEKDTDFNEEQSVSFLLDVQSGQSTACVELPSDVAFVRLDLDQGQSNVLLTGASVANSEDRLEIPAQRLTQCEANQLALKETDEGVWLEPQGNDPFLVWDRATLFSRELNQTVRRGTLPLVVAAIINVIVIGAMGMLIRPIRKILMGLLNKIRVLRPILWTAKEHWDARDMLLRLAQNDFKARFANSVLGSVWAFVTPLTTMLVFWFVFQVGLRNDDISGYPFIVWYAPAFLSWTFFAEAWSAATNSIREYSYLMRKVNYRVSITPTIKLLSAALVHAAFILFIFVLNLFYGIDPNLYYLQVIYYFACLLCLLFGLAMLCSSLTPFLGDAPSIVGVITQVGFWATPIVWNADNMSNTAVRMALQLNPMYYICNGYRDCFVDHVWFWQRPVQTLYFWGLTFFIVIIGCATFKRLSLQFVDVL